MISQLMEKTTLEKRKKAVCKRRENGGKGKSERRMEENQKVGITKEKKILKREINEEKEKKQAMWK